MRPVEECKHFWKVIGPQGGRWYDGHAIAKCLHCYARTVVEYQGASMGPCEHSLGLYSAEPPIEKEDVAVARSILPAVDPAYVDCLDCRAIAAATAFGAEIKLCPKHQPKKSRAKAKPKSRK